MMRLSIIVLLLLSSYSSLSQDNSLSNSQTLRNYSDRVGSLNSFTRTVPVIVGKETGTSYLLDSFQTIMMEMAFTNDTIVLQKANYHLELQTVVFENEDKLESVRPIFLSRFQILENEGDRVSYVNKKSLLESLDRGNSQISRSEGFLQEISISDNCSLYRDWYLHITEPTYNEALDIGSKERILKRENNYSLVYKNTYYENFKLSNKRLKEIFGSSAKIKSFMKENNLKGNTESELAQLVDYICSWN